MTDPGTRVCALILAAGEGRRLRPITETVPKALCPVGNVALLDRALARLAVHGLSGTADVAVNACYLADLVADRVAGRAHVSFEPGPPALGTGGAVAQLREWIAGRAVLVGNADAYLAPTGDGPDLTPLLRGWDGDTVRVLGVPATETRAPEFGDWRFAGFSLLPARVVAELPVGRSELVQTVWRPAERAGRFEVVAYDGWYLDTGTPADFLAANLHVAGAGSLIAEHAQVTGTAERSVIGAGAVVAGSVTRTVVFPGATVRPDETLTDAIRVGSATTVIARGDSGES